MSRHLVIPDTQCAPNTPLDHFDWIGRAILEYRPDVIIHLGDHWDFESLSRWDRGAPQKMEGRRLIKDLKAGNQAMDRLLAPLRKYTARSKGKARYRPRFVFLDGNHEDRLTRRISELPYELEGLVSLEANLNRREWEVFPYRQQVLIDGVWYAHFFYNPDTGNPYGGTIENRLKNIGVSFTQGHQQGLRYGMRQLVNGKRQYGLVAGSCYLHDEEYRGPQANGEWRGIVVKNDVHDGAYDIMPLSLKYLREKFG